MDPTLLDLAAAILDASSRALVPISELAPAVGTEPGVLLNRLHEDDRFLLVQPGGFPDLTMLPAEEREVYTEALRAAGVHAAPLVALAAPEPGDHPTALLRQSVARLLAREPEPELATSAERLGRVIEEALQPYRTDRSTTPPPGPPPADRVPPRRRPPSPRRPPYPGSHRG